MVMVLNSVGRRFLVFSKVRLTSARPLALRVLEPLNTRLSRFSDRRWEIFCSPITHLMLSTILLLPQPLGPTMPVIFSSKFTWVLSAKLLKPLISSDFNRTLQLFMTGKDSGMGRKTTFISPAGIRDYAHFVHRKQGSEFKPGWILIILRPNQKKLNKTYDDDNCSNRLFYCCQ